MKALDWLLNCPRCGFEFSIFFDSNVSESEKSKIRKCPCGQIMTVKKQKEVNVNEG